MSDPNDFESRRQLLRLEMLYEIGLAINESLDPTHVAQEVLDRALMMMDARGAMLFVKNENEGLEVIARVGDGEPSELLELEELHEAWNSRSLVQSDHETALGHHLCIVPLESHKEVSGLLVLADRERRDGTTGPFSESDETLLHSFAYQAGIAINNAQLHRRLEQAYEQLRQAQKMEALGQLAGGVAHDFNNLLTIINGYSELGQLKTEQGSPLHDNLDEIRQAGTRAASLTRQLLAFTRHQVTQPEVLDLNTLIGDMQKMLGRLISESVEFSFDPEPDLGLVKADPGQIQQIVMNLSINARDAMPRGGTLSVETKNVDLDENYARQHLEVKPGPYARFSVGDTGTGMDAGTKEQIFTPFFTTKGVGEGTGLGLAMVQSITRQHDGHTATYVIAGRYHSLLKTLANAYLDVLPKAEQALFLEEVRQGLHPLLCDDDGVWTADYVRLRFDARKPGQL